MTNEREQIGGNNPPDVMDEALAQYAGSIADAQIWTKGIPVKTRAECDAVDALTKEVKRALKAAKDVQRDESKPHFDAHKAALARRKPEIDDLSTIVDCLVKSVALFKQKLAAEKREAERKAYEEAERKRREAEAAAAQADASDLDAQREAAAKAQEAQDAKEAASAASKDTVKGMRKVKKYEIEDRRSALHWIAQNNRAAVTAFIDEYVRKHHKDASIDGVRVWQESEAF